MELKAKLAGNIITIEPENETDKKGKNTVEEFSEKLLETAKGGDYGIIKFNPGSFENKEGFNIVVKCGEVCLDREDPNLRANMKAIATKLSMETLPPDLAGLCTKIEQEQQKKQEQAAKKKQEQQEKPEQEKKEKQEREQKTEQKQKQKKT